MCWTSRRRESTPSLAPRPRRWSARSGRGLSLWSCLWLRPAGSVCLRVPVSRRWRFARHRTKRPALSSARRGVPLAAPSANRSGAVSPTTARSRPRRSRRQDRLDPRRGAVSSRPRVDHHRLSCRAAPIASRRSDNARGDRIRARFVDRFDEPAANGAERAWAIGVALCAQGRASARRRRRLQGRSRARFWRCAQERQGARTPRSFTVRRSHRGCVPFISYLRALDASGAARIAVASIPEHGLGEAINDRLRRAAAPRDVPI